MAKTKAALKRRNARLMVKRDQMNAEIEGNEKEIREIDSMESRQLLEKFNIESEELAKLILMRQNENKAVIESAEKKAEPEQGKREMVTQWSSRGTARPDTVGSLQKHDGISPENSDIRQRGDSTEDYETTKKPDMKGDLDQ